MRLEGDIESIIYTNAETGYRILTIVDDSEEEYTLVGVLEGADPGLHIVAEAVSEEHAIYGTQYRVNSFELAMPVSMDAVEYYLASGSIKGVGQVTAKLIVKHFGKDTLRIMEEEPERLAEIKGISAKKAQDIGLQYRDSVGYRQALMFLSKFAVTPRLAMKIYQVYNNRIYQVVKENPYRIAEDVPGIGFKTADDIAIKSGISYHSEYRVRAAVIYTMSRIGDLGHTYLPQNMLVKKVNSFLLSGSGEFAFDEDYTEEVLRQIAELQLEKKLVIREDEAGPIVYLTPVYYMELHTAGYLLDMSREFALSEEEFQKRMMKIPVKGQVVLDAEQKHAVYLAASSGLTIITGGPGTGKTTVINTIIGYFLQEGLAVSLAAPTGRAAKRMTEATGYQARTIHRLLEVSGGTEDGEQGFSFGRNEEKPLEADVVIIDEVSMVDAYLANSLLKAIVPGTHLILVGDVNQLPSVGSGNVLKDIIRSEVFPVVRLNTIYRQEEESDIVTNAHKILRGEYPKMDNQSKDFFLMSRRTAGEIIEETGKLVATKMPKYVNADPMEVQVLTPMRQGDLGVEGLNRELQRILNPPSDKKQEYEAHHTLFREGDKVMQIRNNYKQEWSIRDPKGNFDVDNGVGVFNGDMGVIKEINKFAQELTVLMDDDKRVVYDFKMLDELELAYAVTIHKSQGSEYPAVILPLLDGPKMLLHRNLLYTAITRAKKCVVIVGNGYVIHRMVDNADEQKRYTGLCRAILEMKEEYEADR